jgi:hypothetical protein
MNSLFKGMTIKELRDNRININQIQMIFKKSFDFKAECIKGFSIIQPSIFENSNISKCKILYLNDDLTIKEKKNIQLEFNTAKERLELLKGEKSILEKKIEKIQNSNCQVLITKNEISEILQYEFDGIIIISNVSPPIFEKSVKSLHGVVVDDVLSISNMDDVLSECDELIIENDEIQT